MHKTLETLKRTRFSVLIPDMPRYVAVCSGMPHVLTTLTYVSGDT